MGDRVEGAGFWLPSEFFTDDDFLIDKENLKKDNNPTGLDLDSDSNSNICFPNEFPYHSEKCWVMSTSPQSTLARFPSPPATPLGAKNNAVSVGELIYRTAGQVAKLKLSQVFQGPPTGFTAPVPQNTQFQQQSKGRGVWYSQKQMYQNKNGRGLGETGHAAWAIQPNPAHFVGSGTRAVFLGGSGGGPVKRECAGTGVFLPRRYGNNVHPSDSRKKTAFTTTAAVQNRDAVDALTKNIDTMVGFNPRQPVSQPRLNQGFIQDFDHLMAQRQALMLQQRRGLLLAEGSTRMSRSMYLPQEWTY